MNPKKPLEYEIWNPCTGECYFFEKVKIPQSVFGMGWINSGFIERSKSEKDQN